MSRSDLIGRLVVGKGCIPTQLPVNMRVLRLEDLCITTFPINLEVLLNFIRIFFILFLDQRRRLTISLKFGAASSFLGFDRYFEAYW
jgi:hypothetical protein